MTWKNTGFTGYWVRSAAITAADKNTTKECIEVPAKTFVDKVVLIITTALSGGSPSLDIGDGDNADGWIDTTDVTETTKGSYVGTAANTAAYSDTGRYYETADTIDAVVADGLTSGNAYVLAHFLPLGDLV